MAAGDWTWYGVGPNVDLSSGTFKIMLTTSTHTPNQDTHDFRDDVTNEVAGTGYTAGGVTVTVTRTYDAASNEIRVAVQDAVWGPGATITFRNAHLYKDTAGADSTDPLIAYIAYGSDQSVSNGTLTIDNAAVTLKGTVGAP
jgi:hypothetical protein